MRAHFAGDVVSAENSIDELESNQQERQEQWQQQQQHVDERTARIADFKRDAGNMSVVSQFIDDVLQNAETEAQKQQNAKNAKTSQKPKEKSRQSFTIPDFKNGKVVNRARGLVVRLFDAICNCANTAAAAAPTQRIKLRGKRASSTSAAGKDETVAINAEDTINTKEKTKKPEKTKDKKDDKKKIDDEEPPQQKNKVDETLLQ